MPGQHTDIATRAFVVALKSPCVGKATPEVAAITGISARRVNRIYARAIRRGYDPNLRPIAIKDAHLVDSPSSGRPSKQTTKNKELVLRKTRPDAHGRDEACDAIAGELADADSSISAARRGSAQDEAHEDEEAWSDTEEEGGMP